MTACAFDTLIVALRDAVVSADGALQRRRHALMDPGADPTDTHALHVNLPADPRPDAPLETVVLPLRLFRDRRTPHIASMSVEFDGWFRIARPWGRARSEVSMVLGKPRFAWLNRHTMHHVKLSFLARDAWQASVEIDGRPLPLRPDSVTRLPT